MSQMTAEQVIECTIGLFDKPVKRGKYPPVLAAEILAALAKEGYILMQQIQPEPPPAGEHVDQLPRCVDCGRPMPSGRCTLGDCFSTWGRPEASVPNAPSCSTP